MIKTSRKLLRIIFTLIVLIATPYILLYFFINEQGKDIFLNSLKDKYNIEAHLDNLSFSIPFRISLDNFKWQNISFVQTTIDLGGYNPLTHTITISNLHIKGLRIKIDKNGLMPIAVKKNYQKKYVPSAVSSLSIVGPLFIKINTIEVDTANIFFETNSLNHSLNVGLEDIVGTIKNVR